MYVQQKKKKINNNHSRTSTRRFDVTNYIRGALFVIVSRIPSRDDDGQVEEYSSYNTTRMNCNKKKKISRFQRLFFVVSLRFSAFVFLAILVPEPNERSVLGFTTILYHKGVTVFVSGNELRV